MRFFPREKGKTGFVEGFSLKKAVSPFSRGQNRISKGVENRGSLVSVPLALRVCALRPVLLHPILWQSWALGSYCGGNFSRLPPIRNRDTSYRYEENAHPTIWRISARSLHSSWLGRVELGMVTYIFKFNGTSLPFLGSAFR